MYNSIQYSNRIGIFTHMNPDGDALGSSFGLAGYLKDINKEFCIFLPSDSGDSLHFMIPEEMKKNIYIWNPNREDKVKEIIDGCDLLIGLDFNTAERIGGYTELFTSSKSKKLLVDHHIGPDTELFDVVYSRPEASSTCELLYELLKEMPEIQGDASKMNVITREALMTGMTTDTNNFSNSVTPATFAMASELIAAGTDRDTIIQNLYFSYPERRIKAQGYILDHLMKITDDGVAYIILDRRIQNKFRLKEGDTEGFVNIPLAIKHVRMCILLKRELKTKKIRVSIRSKKGTSARNLAMRYYHGGGHEQASGGRLMVGEDIKRMSELPEYIENSVRNFFMEQ